MTAFAMTANHAPGSVDGVLELFYLDLHACDPCR